MKKLGRSAVLIIFTIVIAFVAFSMLASLHGHNCVGDDCPVCQLLNDVKRLIQDSLSPIIVFAYSCALATPVARLLVGVVCQNETPVLQRVKITS